MSTIVIHDGPPEHALVLTSLISGLYQQYGAHKIAWVTSDRNMVFFQAMKGVEVRSLETLKADGVEYDRCISYGGSVPAILAPTIIKARSYYGLYSPNNNLMTSEQHVNPVEARTVYQILYGDRETRQNIFQVMYQMAGLTWRGEGYGFRYYPKAKEKTNVVGVAIANEKVREYIKSHLEVVERKLWHVPIKQDPMKQFDEVNRCASLITDNPLVMHIAVALRKHVEYLVYRPPFMRMQFFGNGFCHLIPEQIYTSEA